MKLLILTLLILTELGAQAFARSYNASEISDPTVRQPNESSDKANPGSCEVLNTTSLDGPSLDTGRTKKSVLDAKGQGSDEGKADQNKDQGKTN